MDAANNEEQRLKRKMHSFMNEMCNFGMCHGFKYFHTYLRGREELIVRIRTETSFIEEKAAESNLRKKSYDMNFSDSITEQPHDNSSNRQSLLMSLRTQKMLNRCSDVSVGLPPASPSLGETSCEDESETVLLLGAYAHYLCPYVWVRSNHERLVQMKLTDQDRDSPLRLKATVNWTSEEVLPSQIVAELVRLCCCPRPINPFAIDFDYFDALTLPGALLAEGAAISLLQKIVTTERGYPRYIAEVMSDLDELHRRHFHHLRQIAMKQ